LKLLILITLVFTSCSQSNVGHKEFLNFFQKCNFSNSLSLSAIENKPKINDKTRYYVKAICKKISKIDGRIKEVRRLNNTMIQVIDEEDSFLKYDFSSPFIDWNDLNASKEVYFTRVGAILFLCYLSSKGEYILLTSEIINRSN